ncbi:MAG: hypothetical protein U1E45_13415 [Geminicoccaceae bacterium]
MDENLLRQIKGGPELLTWFDHPPSFHDGEIVRLELNREGTVCRFDVWHWNHREELVDGETRCKTNYGIITFELWGVYEIELFDFNFQNVVSEIELEKLPDGTYRIEIGQCHGLYGHICARDICFGLLPGLPPDRIRPKVP